MFFSNIRENETQLLVEELDKTRFRSLDCLPTFEGSGIYALYYVGELELYKGLKEANTPIPQWPIYVGKASSLDSRKGIVKKSDQSLRRRLGDHIKSINSTDLQVSDFFIKYIIIDDLSIPFVENVIIRKYSPLWNQILCGFGNHSPGKPRLNGKMTRPFWDTVHPGRDWATQCAPRKETVIELQDMVKDFLANTIQVNNLLTTRNEIKKVDRLPI